MIWQITEGLGAGVVAAFVVVLAIFIFFLLTADWSH